MAVYPAAVQRRACAGVLLALCLAACQSPPQSPSAVPLPHQVLVRSHLATLVEMRGFPCGAVLEHSRIERLDYQVVCDTGRAYRVWLGPAGQVMVQPMDDSLPAGIVPRAAEPPASAPG